MQTFKQFWKKKNSFIDSLNDMKETNLSAVSSYALWESLKWDPANKKILDELKKRGHQPGSKWAKEANMTL